MIHWSSKNNYLLYLGSRKYNQFISKEGVEERGILDWKKKAPHPGGIDRLVPSPLRHSMGSL